ncbi:MAG: hypothetical protein E7405_00050 [Ruminococcaceae bacterium]|nr:hypothetical protein [Oscillospiraceae bacterium]
MYTDTVRKLFIWATVIIAIAGIAIGIFIGYLLMSPAEGFYYVVEWTWLSTGAMIGVWILYSPVVIAFHGLHKIIQILDNIRKNTEKE